jgi:hypothetical protein
MRIDELDKPNGQWCPNCQVGRGCTIYGAHPPSCRTFICEWLRNPDVPESFRPNRIKVILTTEPADDGMRLIADCDASSPMAWREQPVYGWLKDKAARSWLRGGYVMVRIVDRYWLIGPNGDLDAGEFRDGAAFGMEQRRDGTYAVER